jgi:hypothetical protein
MSQDQLARASLLEPKGAGRKAGLLRRSLVVRGDLWIHGRESDVGVDYRR